MSGHTVTPFVVFPLSQPLLHTPLSSEDDLRSSDLNLDSEKRPLDRCPMLMLRTTRDVLAGLCRTCFNTAVFLSAGVATGLSAGWMKVTAQPSSTGKSVVRTPFRW